MRKALVAAALVAVSTLTTMGAASADAAPAGTASCGFSQNRSTGRALYENCSDVGESVYVVMEFGMSIICVPAHSVKWLGGWEVNGAYPLGAC